MSADKSGWVRLDAVLNALLRTLCLLAFTVLLLLVTFEILSRFITLFPLGWADEVVEMSFACLIFLGSAVLWRGRAHFSVDLLPDLLKGTRSGTVLAIALNGLALAFFLVFGYEGLMLSVRTTTESPILALPKTLWYMVMPIAGLIMVGYTVRDVWLLCHGQSLEPEAVREGH
jgi:TRAP-type C4-dicarboxylate transport system permease small subunit